MNRQDAKTPGNIFTFFLFILLTLLFLTAAKSHGRQHRLERELEGHWTVSFTSENHPWVERFWLRQRILYWSIASIAAILFLRYRNNFFFYENRKLQWILFAVFAIAASMIFAFIVTGWISWARLAYKLSSRFVSPSFDWLQNLHLISLGWWLLTTFLMVLMVKLISFRGS